MDARSLSCEALAYLGDAIWELHVRRSQLWPPDRMHALHRRVVSRVCAEAQASLVVALDPYLSVEERDLVRRGRNAPQSIPRRLDPATYRLASALETLLGYLHLTSPERLEVVLHLCDELIDGTKVPSPAPEAPQ